MDIQLTPDLEALVQSKVQTGRYDSASDVMREALRLMEKRDRAKAEIRQQIAEGVASAKAGRLTDGDEFMDQLEAELEEEIRAEEQAEREKAAL